MTQTPRPGSNPTAAAPGGAEASASFPPPLRQDPSPGLLRGTLHAVYDAVWIFLIALASPWWVGRSFFDRGFRAMVLGRLTLGLPRIPATAGSRPILIHGVSVGEVKAAQSLVLELEREHPQHQIVVSTTTGTGFELARKLFAQHTVVGFPLDLSFFVRRFLSRIQPACAVLIELEIWPNFLREANRRGVPVAVVNGRITRKSYENYQRFGRTLPQFNRISVFCAQNELYAERFASLAGSSERIVVTGNIKFDNLSAASGDGPPLAQNAELRGFIARKPGQAVLVAGSTHEGEELQVERAFREGAPGSRVVLIPRHPGRCRDLLRSFAAQGIDVQLLTDLRAGADLDPTRPLIVDTIGELEDVCSLADLVFVGGSLVPHGGHNLLEPAAHGIPVLHGPHMENFRDEEELLRSAGASAQVEDASELARTVRELLESPERAHAMGAAGRGAIERQQGASAATRRQLSASCL